ncbi:MAG: hypothetical protein H6935_16370 [Thiobacillus sp.]|nr:hypothetical protein [Thiobacillus sp.]
MSMNLGPIAAFHLQQSIRRSELEHFCIPLNVHGVLSPGLLQKIGMPSDEVLGRFLRSVTLHDGRPTPDDPKDVRVSLCIIHESRKSIGGEQQKTPGREPFFQIAVNLQPTVAELVEKSYGLKNYS